MRNLDARHNHSDGRRSRTVGRRVLCGYNHSDRKPQQRSQRLKPGIVREGRAVKSREDIGLLRVNNGPDGPSARLPLYPRKQTQSGHRTMSGSCHERSFRRYDAYLDDSTGAVSSIPPSITHWLRSMSRLSPADTVEALLYGGEAVVD